MKTDSGKIRAATVQFQHRPGDKDYNFSRVAHFTKKAAAKKAAIVVFPEMCLSGYWHIRNLPRQQLLDLAEYVPGGPLSKKLGVLAKQSQLIIGAGLLEKTRNGKLYNTYLVAFPNGTIKKHRKLHAFESPYISSGDSYTVFPVTVPSSEGVKKVKLGILICYDNNIFENVRMTALLGADILLAPHQTGGTNSRSPYGMKPIDPALWFDRKKHPEKIEAEFAGPKGRGWLMRWLPSRAHDNGLFLIFSNGIGEDDGEVRTGNAMLIDPYGRIIKETGKAEDTIVIGDLDLSLLQMSTGRRWMRGRRPELYALLSKQTGKELSPQEARFSTKRT